MSPPGGPSGRPVLEDEDPLTPQQKLGWLLRTLRLSSGDPRLHHLGMAEEVARERGLRLSRGLIGRAELGGHGLSVERCREFEQLLGLQVGTLVDVYCYLMRTFRERPTWGRRLEDAAAAERPALVRRLFSEGQLSAWEWLELSRADPSGLALLGGVERVGRAYYAGLGRSYEADERLLLDAGVGLRPVVGPMMGEAFSEDPDGTYNLVETLAYEPAAGVADQLVRLVDLLDDEFLAQCYLDVHRRLAEDHGRPLEAAPHLSEVRDFAVAAVQDESAFFCVREESAAYLRSLAGARARPLPAGGARGLEEVLRRLSPAPGDRALARVRATLTETTHAAAREAGVPVRAGLVRVVTQALTAPGRRERLAHAVLLRPWQGRTLVVDAVLRTLDDDQLLRVPAYVHACIRLITKVEAENSGSALVRIADLALDEDCRSILAFGLGGVSDPGARAALARISLLGGTPSTRRNVLIARRRQAGPDDGSPFTGAGPAQSEYPRAV